MTPQGAENIGLAACTRVVIGAWLSTILTMDPLAYLVRLKVTPGAVTLPGRRRAGLL